MDEADAKFHRLWRIAILATAISTAAVGSWIWWYVRHGSPEARHRAIVRLHLKDPESARFKEARPAKRGGDGIWCGELNARNSMGGYVGYTRYIAEMPNASTDDEEIQRLLSKVTFDNDNDTGFSNKWSLMCEGN